jgi:hypothetical protein
MGRPLKNGLDYFQHDTDMSYDEKIEALEMVHGNDGYAVYNKLLERIYRSAGKLDLSNDVQRLSIAKKCNVPVEKFDQIIADSVRFELFDAESWQKEHRLTSARIRRQLQVVEAEREEWRGKSHGKTHQNTELSGEKTPSATGSLNRKVHKAEQSRLEQSRGEESSSRLGENSGQSPATAAPAGESAAAAAASPDGGEEDRPAPALTVEQLQDHLAFHRDFGINLDDATAERVLAGMREHDAASLAFADFVLARMKQKHRTASINNPAGFFLHLLEAGDEFKAWERRKPPPPGPAPPPCPACGRPLRRVAGDPASWICEPEKRTWIREGEQLRPAEPDEDFFARPEKQEVIA